MNRNQFLKLGAAGAVAAMIPKGFSIGSTGSSLSKLNVAIIGAGNMGAHAVEEAARSQNLVALCDVDWRPEIDGRRSERSAAAMAAAHPDVPRFDDFREMLTTLDQGIDAVLISTPDHTHFAATMASMEMGKHLFVQKPLTHNIWQSRTLQKAMHRYGVKTNMGNQGHTWEGMRLIKEWVDAGVIGEVREVHCWTDRPRMPWFKRMQTPPPYQFVPDKVAWDLWLGPAEARPFSDQYMPTLWRGWWDFGAGSLGDIGCHCLDAPFWALQLTTPTAVDVLLDEPADPIYTAFGAHVIFHFPARGTLPPVKLHWYEGRPRPPLLPGMEKLPTNGMYMLGAREILYHEGMRPQSPMLWPRERMMEYQNVLKQRPLPRVKDGPIQELFAAISGAGPEPGSNFDYAAPLTETVLLGTLAIRAGHRIEYDAASMTITNRPELNAWIKPPAREGWTYGENLWKTT